MPNNIDRKIVDFKSRMKDILGDTMRKPISARLGYIDDEGQEYLDVPTTIADQPSQYYFSNAGGQAFVGQAYLQDGAIAEWQLRVGAPIRVKKDVINDTWEIIGLDVIYSAEYFDGVDQESVTLIPLRRFAPGLLTSTIPYSMRAIVIGGAYDVGDEFRYVNTLETVDWSTSPYSANVPDVGLAVFVLVQIDVNNGVLEYKYGSEMPASTTFEQAYNFQISNSLTGILPEKDVGRFRCGYVKLAGGMTAIDRRKNIWSIQQVLGSSSTGDDLADTLFPRIVTDGDNVVVAGDDVVWISAS